MAFHIEPAPRRSVVRDGARQPHPGPQPADIRSDWRRASIRHRRADKVARLHPEESSGSWRLRRSGNQPQQFGPQHCKRVCPPNAFPRQRAIEFRGVRFGQQGWTRLFAERNRESRLLGYQVEFEDLRILRREQPEQSEQLSQLVEPQQFLGWSSHLWKRKLALVKQFPWVLRLALVKQFPRVLRLPVVEQRIFGFPVFRRRLELWGKEQQFVFRQPSHPLASSRPRGCLEIVCPRAVRAARTEVALPWGFPRPS